MEKEKQIEKMAKIVDEMYYVYDTKAEDISQGLYESGYGNVKEAVKEFAEGLIKNGVYSCKGSTVKEVAESLVEQFENHIKEYAKEYGVEVEK